MQSMKPLTILDPLIFSASYHRESPVELDPLVPLEPVVPLATLACPVCLDPRERLDVR